MRGANSGFVTCWDGSQPAELRVPGSPNDELRDEFAESMSRVVGKTHGDLCSVALVLDPHHLAGVVNLGQHLATIEETPTRLRNVCARRDTAMHAGGGCSVCLGDSLEYIYTYIAEEDT